MSMLIVNYMLSPKIIIVCIHQSNADLLILSGLHILRVVKEYATCNYKEDMVMSCYYIFMLHICTV